MNMWFLTLSIVILSLSVMGKTFAANFGGPDTVGNTIANQKTQRLTWREQLTASGVTFGLDYNVMGLTSPNGAQGNTVDSASGVLRFYGQWDLVGRNSTNTGGLVWKIEHRHAFTDYAPKQYAFLSDLNGKEGLGYIGMIQPAYSDQGGRMTNFHWKQRFNSDKTSLIVGFQDVTDYVDAYALASPWTGFYNLAFQTGSGAIGLPDDGLLALSVGHMIIENYYLIAGVADANGRSDINDIFDGFDSFFNDNDYFTTLELGWTVSQEQIYTDNIHLTYWHIDATFNDDGSVRHSAKGSQGLNYSLSYFTTPQIMPFLRGGFSFQGDAALYETSISVGFGYFGLGSDNNNLGVALNWSQANEESWGTDDSQTVLEVYYNMQFGDYFQVTPDFQWINGPILSRESNTYVFGLRGRLFI
ncbi:carbohydrate-selective porin OprB [Photobacterium gaetbulicola Gung47]|uniref:Carbohydrate-selective porin OprB n=1 Tax=Photobacterium gaetbulicola Gung47 TaxID=658445 RepID=A0A0C5WZG8_9GAMM|nr:carbohydrate-selective porin OprB [Photobacterium gaetbulicola Gung47]